MEKLAEPGGAAIISGGGCLIVGSPLQKKLGIADTPDLAFADWMAWGGPSADAVWARYYIEHTLHDLYHWAERQGVRWVDAKPQEGNSVVRWTRAEKSGLGLMTALIRSYNAKGGQLLPGTRVERLIVENGKVTGFDAASGAQAQPVRVAARSVIVASGGFNSNLDMVLEVRPDLTGDRILEGSGLGATGDGHKLVSSVGGYLTHMDHLWFYVYATPDPRDERGRRGLVFRLAPGYIWVNAQGNRFHNEALSGGNSGAPALFAQSPRNAWAILDQPMADRMEFADPYYRADDKPLRDRIQTLLDTSPHICKAASLDELARKAGLPVETFRTTVARYNGHFGKDLAAEPDFGKPLGSSKPFDTPPYYAIQIFPLARKNFGGVKTDKQARVLDRHFDPIPGLFAAGEVAGMAGGHINGRAGLEGTMLGPSLFSGRVAGGWAAQGAGFGRGFIGRPNR